jgi:hypothetical protein
MPCLERSECNLHTSLVEDHSFAIFAGK